MQYAFILGNTPKLSVLEIKAILSGFTVKKESEEVLIVETKKEINTKELINILGGTIKIAVLTPSIPLSVPGEGEVRFKYGFSIYSLDNSLSKNYLQKIKQEYRRKGLDFKKKLRQEGKRAELIESRDLALSSVIVEKEKCLDIIILAEKDKLLFGKTEAFQPFRDFSHRDYDRPQKDMRAGMLPPKVARMMVNISQGKKDEILLDPFCGSGTILQEALLLGYKKVIGSDISEKAISDTETNLKFLNLENYELLNVDARNLNNMSLQNAVSTIVTEVHLGPPNIYPQKLLPVIKELTNLYKTAFANLKNVLNKDAKLVVAFPAWRFNNQITHLPISDVLQKLGFKLKGRPVLYGRPDAKVLREIYILNLPRPPA